MNWYDSLQSACVYLKSRLKIALEHPLNWPPEKNWNNQCFPQCYQNSPLSALALES